MTTTPIKETHKGTQKKRDLYLGIIYPGGKYSWQMITNLAAFMDMADDTLNVIPIIVTAGTFSHRHQKIKPDKHQCLMRQKYLDAVPVGEWLMVIDSDEVLFGALDKISAVCDLMDHNNIDFGMVPMEHPDGLVQLYPRLIKKREGLQYGGVPNEKGVLWKHDMIAHTRENPNVEFGREAYNYIDVYDENRSYTINFLKFFHYKKGVAFQVFPKEKIVDIPRHFVEVKDLELCDLQRAAAERGEYGLCDHTTAGICNLYPKNTVKTIPLGDRIYE